VLKGLPLTYNRDLQEDKAIVFNAVDTTLASLSAMSQLVETTTFNAERMSQSLVRDFSTATDLADYLVQKGLPFREAHRVVGQLVLHLSEQGKGLEDATLDDLRLFNEKFDTDALEILQPEKSVERRKELAGTAKRSVQRQLRQAKSELERTKKWLEGFPRVSEQIERLLGK